MFFRLVNALFVSCALVFSTAAFAADPLIRISPSDEDFGYYMKAVELDQEYVNDGLIGFYSDYSFKGDHDLGTISGRIVAFLDGTTRNPRNLVLTVNGNLYYVDTKLAGITSPLRVRRSWEKDNPGMFLVVEGYRRGSTRVETVPIRASIKVATVNAKSLPVLQYSEETLGKGANRR